MAQCLAKQAFDQQWEVIKARILRNEYLQLNETYKGRSAIHWTAIHGNAMVLEMLLSLEDIDKVDVSDRRTALHFAADHNQVECLKLLLDYGANKDVKDINGMTPLHVAAKQNHEAIIRILLQGHAQVNVLDHSGKTPLDLAYGTAKTWMRQTSTFTNHMRDFTFIDDGDEDKLRKWLNECPGEIDLYDQERRTALMHAVLANREEMVHLILRRGPNVDQTDFDGMTALMHAVHVGNHEIVSMILAEFADLDIEDTNGNTAMMHIGDVIAAHRGFDMSDWEHCKSLLKKENVYRSTSEEYRERFQQKVEAAIRKQTGFNESLFRRAINRHPELGIMFLNECMVVDRHAIGFHHLGLIYGKAVRTSALYCMFHPQNPDVQYRINKSVLSHLVMRRVVELKWEMFGERIYLQQILAYLLLLSTMTISAFLVGTDISTSSSQTSVKEEDISIADACRFNWCFVVSFVFCGRIMVKGLHPEYFWSCSRFLYDGKWTEFNPDVVIPNLPKYKRRVKMMLGAITMIGTGLLTYLVNWHVFPWLGITESNPLAFYIGNNIVLWFTALYFLRLEVRELLGESGNFIRGLRPATAQESKLFRRGAKNYFSSSVNRIQLTLYCSILFIYVPLSILYVRDALLGNYDTWGPNADKSLEGYGAVGSSISSLLKFTFTGPPMTSFDVDLLRFVLAIGGFISLALWFLTLQFLEIHPTAGFLLPMLPAMLTDMWNFCIFYAAIDWGFTACFYIYLHGTNQSIAMFGHTFTSVFFVMFGQQLDIADPFPAKENNGTEAARIAYEMYGTGLAMLHASVVVVFMLNLLLAMMNKSMGDGLERAKTEALASYARCILRMELSMENHDTSQYITVSERDPITNEPLRYLNPAFSESKNKSDFAISASDEAILRSFDESTKEWHGGLKGLKSAILFQWGQLRQEILELDIPTDTKQKLQKALDKRESAIRSLIATASAATHPTKLNVETRFATLGEQIQTELEKLIEVDPELLTDCVANMKNVVSEAFNSQIEKTREAMCEPGDVNFGEMWKFTQLQWKRQEKRLQDMQKRIILDMESSIQNLTSKLDALLQDTKPSSPSITSRPNFGRQTTIL